VSVKASMEMESIESLTSMVAHNLGVSIVPDVSVPDAIFSTLRKIRLPKPRQSRTLGVVSRVDNGKMRLIERLTEQLRFTVKGCQSTTRLLKTLLITRLNSSRPFLASNWQASSIKSKPARTFTISRQTKKTREWGCARERSWVANARRLSCKTPLSVSR